MIKPTVGRVVLFIPKESSYAFEYCINAGKEHSARIAYVHGDRMVNLEIIDANGKSFNRTSITLVQEGDAPYDGDHCRWMPFQVGQAKAQSAA